MAKAEIKTADASAASQVRMLRCKALKPCKTAFLPTGEAIEFKGGFALVTPEQAEHLQDPTRFSFDEPEPEPEPTPEPKPDGEGK